VVRVIFERTRRGRHQRQEASNIFIPGGSESYVSFSTKPVDGGVSVRWVNTIRSTWPRHGPGPIHTRDYVSFWNGISTRDYCYVLYAVTFNQNITRTFPPGGERPDFVFSARSVKQHAVRLGGSGGAPLFHPQRVGPES
jgi:hypothetical protein